MPGQPRIVLNSKLYYVSLYKRRALKCLCEHLRRRRDVAMASGLKSNKMRPPLPLSVCLYLGIFDKIREERSGGAVRAKWHSNRRRRRRTKELRNRPPPFNRQNQGEAAKSGRRSILHTKGRSCRHKVRGWLVWWKCGSFSSTETTLK